MYDNSKHLSGISQECIGCKNVLLGVCSKKQKTLERWCLRRTYCLSMEYEGNTVDSFLCKWISGSQLGI